MAGRPPCRGQRAALATIVLLTAILGPGAALATMDWRSGFEFGKWGDGWWLNGDDGVFGAGNWTSAAAARSGKAGLAVTVLQLLSPPSPRKVSPQVSNNRQRLFHEVCIHSAGVSLCVRACVRMHVRVRVHVPMCVRACTHVHARMCTCACMCVCARMCACA